MMVVHHDEEDAGWYHYVEPKKYEHCEVHSAKMEQEEKMGQKHDESFDVFLSCSLRMYNKKRMLYN